MGKRILFLSWKDITHPAAGGAELLTDALASHLAQTNDVTYVTSSYKGAKPTEQVHGYTVIRKGTIYTVYIHAFIWWHSHISQSKKYACIIDQVHGVPFFSLLYVHHPHVITLVMEIAGGLWKNAPVLVAMCGKILENAWLHIYTGRKIVTISQSTKDDLVAHGIMPSDISIIPMFSHIQCEKMPQKSTTPTLLVIGRIAPVKRIEDAVAAYKIARTSIPSLKLVIIGKTEPAYEAYKARLLRSIEGDAGITLIKNATEEDKVEWLKRSHLLLMTSQKEGYGLVILEAAACGTPSTGYNVAGIQDAIIDNATGLLASSETPEALAHSVTKALADQALFQTMQENAYAHAKEHTITATVRAWDTIMERFLCMRENHDIQNIAAQWEKVSTSVMNDQPSEPYIYASWASLLLRSLQLDIEWLRIKGMPQKYHFILKKYIFLLASPLFWDKEAHAYRIPIWHRDIFVESRSQIGIVQSTFINQSYLQNFIQPGATIIDVGAHTGEFALLCEVLLRASRVHSFEPIKESYALLARNKRSDTYNVAIGKKSERIMYIPPYQSAMASGYSFYPNAKEQTVKCVELDDIPDIQNLASIDLFKIDVEGMEYDVLLASKETIKKARYILMEGSIDRPATEPILSTFDYLRRIAPEFKLVHIGQIFGSPQRTDSVDFLLKNTSLL